LLLFLFNLHNEYFTEEALEGLGDFKIRGQLIRTVKYADSLMLLAKEEKMLQGMIDRLVEIGRCYGKEMNVEKTKVIRLEGEPSQLHIMIDQNNWRMKYLKYLGGIIRNKERRTHEIKFRITMTKAEFNRKKILFTSKFNLNLSKKLMKVLNLEFSIVWC
jgi:hypothetical protein